MKNWFEGSKIEQRHNDYGTSIVLGNCWGDEGKGKITDVLTQKSDVIIRFQGGHNAGHTVVVGDKKYDLHILPSGTVSEGKTNIITSGCVLGIDLNKIDISKIEKNGENIICNYSLKELLKRNEDGEELRVGLIPELEKLEKGGINIKKSGLKISGETPVIGIHNVLLDAYDEVCRINSGLKPIGSTGSGISRAYSSEIQRYHFSLNDLLYSPELFYNSIEALWESYKHIFKKIDVKNLIEESKKEREKIIKYIQSGIIEIISNEKEYIKSLHKSGKKIVGEGAQSSMIGSGNSIFGTASNPSLQTFLNNTGLTVEKIGNIFLVHKLPPSSVGTRPGYLKYPENEGLETFRKKYNEFGVSTKRPRDLFHHSAVETARGAWLNVRGIDDEDKIVPVYNRYDGLEDEIKLLSPEGLKIVTGLKYQFYNILTQEIENICVGVCDDKTTFTPNNLLNNYPEKSFQAQLFDLTNENLVFKKLVGNVLEQKEQLLGIYNGAIYKKDQKKEFIIGTGPDRNDLKLRKGNPLRK